MKSTDKEKIKKIGISVLLLGALPVIIAIFSDEILSVILNISGRILIVIGMLILFVYKNEN